MIRPRRGVLCALVITGFVTGLLLGARSWQAGIPTYQPGMSPDGRSWPGIMRVEWSNAIGDAGLLVLRHTRNS